MIAETAILNCDVAQRLAVLLADARTAAGVCGGADVVFVAVTAGGGAAGVVRVVAALGVLLEGPWALSPQPATTALTTITDTDQRIEFTGHGYPRAPSTKRRHELHRIVSLGARSESVSARIERRRRRRDESGVNVE